MNFSSDKIGTMEKSANALHPAFASCISLDARIIIRIQVNTWSGLSLDDKKLKQNRQVKPVFRSISGFFSPRSESP
jgi:hypothetical protein